MKVSKEELKHLAKLSKIKLTEEEKIKYQENMEDIIGFLDQLKVDEKKDLGKQEKLSYFEWVKSYENPQNLLSNSTHKKWDFIGVKTSIKHN